jgi:hypothetical protein
MTTMSPHDARAAILAGTASDGFTVSGSLDLSDCTGLTALPDGFTVSGSLDLSDCTGLTALPDGLTVDGSLDLSRCTGLTALPDGLTVCGSLYLYGCTGLPHIYADTDRDYYLRRVDTPDGPRWNAGCRHFTTDEALSHWGGAGYPAPARGAAYVAAIRQSLADKSA